MPSDSAWHGKAPGRVNLIGEHVDYLGGLVLPAAVNRFTEVGGRAASEWSVESDVPGGLAYVRAIGEELGVGPQDVHVTSQVPPSAGISSSAALLVAVAVGLRPDMDGKKAALACQRAEQRATGVQVGVMDQFASALGRRGCALLLDCATLDYDLVPFPDEVAMAVIDSGERRNLADTPYNERRREAEAGDPKRMRHVNSEIVRVRAFVKALRARDFARMGQLLKESHRSLRDDFEVSTDNVDALVARADAIDGCYGSRIMGAGFGGSILALVDHSKTEQFVRSMDRPVLICMTADGAYSAASARAEHSN
ncbi:MAG TPA: galactokinase family protein [Candidatus Dormibacteraeota bacterium]|nr:galactokinase family protein [Candidatus Dormibacteraeota bacterium]